MATSRFLNKLNLIMLSILGTMQGVIFAQQAQNPLAGLTGVITNAVSGSPIIGARINVAGFTDFSVLDGSYNLHIDTTGTFVVSCVKAGFVTHTSQPVIFQPGITMPLNIQLWETTNPSPMVNSILDTALQIVFLNWDPPAGEYELIYDDGIQDNFTLWATQGNMNAVKFTPVAYPATVTGGSVHIGKESDYLPGSNPFVPFQLAVYDANGTTGMPGSQISGPYDIIPTGFGWNAFTLSAPVLIQSGSFYLVMIQGGNAPDASGLAIDQSLPQQRSVAKFVTGGTPWVPAGGNFMMRAVVYGSGGPLDRTGYPGQMIQYQMYRLRQGEELNPSVWVSLGATQQQSYSDPSWFNLPCGPYRWGIKTEYANARHSPVSFSNILGKCWTTATSVNVVLSCEQGTNAGTQVRLKNLVYPDTMYSATLDTSGFVTFPTVWKGTYEIMVSKFGYETQCKNIPLSFDTCVSFFLLQKKPPPTGLMINGKSLIAQWELPFYEEILFEEAWNSGSFSTQGWTSEGGYNWIISNNVGNPAPSAMFSWSPQVTNYEQFLKSQLITGLHSPVLNLQYDIYLDNFGTTTENQMAVEIWDGSQWMMIKSYSNSGGSFPWTREELDISAVSDLQFRIRFRAWGEDSYHINGWNIDNILITGEETPTGLKSCILGYNFYLNNILSGFSFDNKYMIPGDQVEYGQTYNGCVLAAYGSGYSTKICTPFTSEFLWPPANLTAMVIEDFVYLQWEKPQMPDTNGLPVTPPGLIGYEIYRNDQVIKHIPGGDTLSYYDMNMDPGTYYYKVTARYDLTDYGFPGQFDESTPAGPALVFMNYGRPLPFFEPWDNGSFSFNEWRFVPEQGNWIINTGTGNPAPSAEFQSSPVQTDYAFALESPALDGSPYTCAKIWLDFELKTSVQNPTGLEKLFVEIYYNNTWHKVAEYANGASSGWSFKHIDISAVATQGFRIRFRANGANSGDILSWMIDNLLVFSACYPASNLQGAQTGNTVLLSWSPPECSGGESLNEGFEEPFFPPANWEILTTNPGSTWVHLQAGSQPGVHSGDYSAGVLWDYSHQDEWLIAGEVLVTGNLQFWSHCYQGSAHDDHYYVKISNDGGNTWDILLDLTELPVYPSPSGYNIWNEPYVLDLSAYAGQIVDIAWQAVDDNGQGLWYSWAIDDCSMITDATVLTGYDIYRKENPGGGFLKINPAPVTDTTYPDTGLTDNEYEYYVTAMFPECQELTNSDTILINVVTSLEEREQKTSVRIYPIPANQIIHIEASGPMVRIELSDLTGRCVLQKNCQSATNVVLGLDKVPAGIYLMKVCFPHRSEVRKIGIVR